MASHTAPPSEADEASPPVTNPQQHDLMRIWAGLQAAADTDSRARKIVEYLSADAARLFGTGVPGNANRA